MNIFYQKRHLIHYGSGASFYFWTVRNLTAPLLVVDNVNIILVIADLVVEHAKNACFIL